MIWTWIVGILTNFNVFKVDTVAPEECKAMQMNIALDSEPLQLVEEGVAKVQGLLSPQHLVAQDESEAGYAGTGPGNVDNLRPITLLLITLHCQPF